jgi:hypothetical protein
MSGVIHAMPPARVPRGGIGILSVESVIGKVNLRGFGGIPPVSWRDERADALGNDHPPGIQHELAHLFLLECRQPARCFLKVYGSALSEPTQQVDRNQS